MSLVARIEGSLDAIQNSNDGTHEENTEMIP
jgi:hypothetical protein